MSEQSLFRRSAPYKSDQQHQEKDEREARLFCATNGTVSVTRLRTFAFGKIRVCVSEQSLFRRFAPYKSDQQHHEKDEREARLFCATNGTVSVTRFAKNI